MDSIEDIAISTYQKNLDYFSTEHPELFKILNVFNSALDSGDYSPNYDLEYMDGYFDIKDLSTNNYLYVEDSNQISKRLSEMLKYKKNTYAFEGFPIYKTSDEYLSNLTDKTIGLEGVYPIMNYYINNTSDEDITKKIEKFMFIGVGLGLHLALVNEKIKAKEYLIVEDDIEIFRLSLFTTSYYELGANAELYFSIADDENLFLQTMDRFINDTFFNNRYMKYSYFPTHSDTKLKLIKNALASQDFTTFAYKIVLAKVLRPLEYINDEYRVLNFAKHFKNNLLSNKPVLLLAAGPSFNKNIDWIKENQDKFIIIAVSATLKKLYENKITPDIVTHIDGFNDSLVHYKDFPAKEFLKDTIAVLGPFSPSKIRSIFAKNNTYYSENDAGYFEGFKPLGLPCVGSFTTIFSLILDVDKVYILGLDLALDQESGETHSDGHAYGKKNNLDNKDELDNTISLRGNIFPVSGNLRQNVYTTSLFHLSVQALHVIIPHMIEEHQTIYNLNDGAKINLSTPKSIVDIDLEQFQSINKEELSNSIHTVFYNYSSDRLNNSDVNSLKKRIKNAQVIKEDILNYINTTSHSNADTYLYDLLGIVSTIMHKTDTESVNIVHVYKSFFKYALPLVIDLLNTKGLKNTKRHIKKLDALVTKEMIEIERIYEETLTDFTKSKC